MAEILGFTVIDCDKVAREVTDNEDLLKSLEAEFKNVVTDGKLDRKALAEKAFATKESTEKLNSIMLPVIVDTIDKKIENLKKSGVKYCLLDAPTLYESGEDKRCDAVITVLADINLRAERIKKRDNLTKEQLESRLNAAQPDDFYKKRAKYILYNNGILTELKEKALEILKEIKEI